MKALRYLRRILGELWMQCFGPEVYVCGACGQVLNDFNREYPSVCCDCFDVLQRTGRAPAIGAGGNRR